MTTTILSPAEAVAETAAYAPKRKLTPEYRARVVEAWSLYMHACEGSYSAKAKLQESLTQSDFPLLFAAALDAKLLAAYESISPIWQGFAARDVLPDFRASTWLDLLGGQGALSQVGEGAPYPRRSVTEAEGSYSLAKYGDTIGLTWEMFINDRLHAFRTLPDRLAVAAREMEDRIATLQLTDGNGPNTTLFSATAGKGVGGATFSTLMTGNPALTEATLGDALLAISTRVDYDGRPVALKGAVLVVPPALQMTAERIVSATEYRETIGTTVVIRTNPLAGKVRVVVNPWLAVLDASAVKNTAWYVLPEPSINARPAAVLGFLAGHEVPDLRVKNDQGNRVGGGAIAPEEGSFEFDTIDYRVRHVLGSGSVDANQVIYSEGDGS
jgi:hypothetical protein